MTEESYVSADAHLAAWGSGEWRHVVLRSHPVGVEGWSQNPATGLYERLPDADTRTLAHPLFASVGGDGAAPGPSPHPAPAVVS